MLINGKEYTMPELDFNSMCSLEDMGVSLTEMDKKVMSTIRGFIALAMDSDMEAAGRELEQHMVSGGKIEPIMDDINKAVNDSGFFRSLRQSKTEGNGQGKTEEGQTAGKEAEVIRNIPV